MELTSRFIHSRYLQFEIDFLSTLFVLFHVRELRFGRRENAATGCSYDEAHSEVLLKTRYTDCHELAHVDLAGTPNAREMIGRRIGRECSFDPPQFTFPRNLLPSGAVIVARGLLLSLLA